jgi:hypothetical protein
MPTILEFVISNESAGRFAKDAFVLAELTNPNLGRI